MSKPSAIALPLGWDDLAERLLASYETCEGGMHHLSGYELPQMSEVVRCVEELRGILFPGFVGTPLAGASGLELREHVKAQLDGVAKRLFRQVYRGLHQRCHVVKGAREHDCTHCAEQAEQIVHTFLDELPALRTVLATDIAAAYEGDPAATGADEVIFCYPGPYAITAYRVANRLLRLGAPIIPRMITEHAHERTGIDIHPGATIGRSFFIDHGTGMVVGETTVIGDRVRIYQGVTLGAISLSKGKIHDKDAHRKKRHPTLEDDVIIYANATILGGDTVIGKGAVIGGNCWVTGSVPAGARVTVDGKTTGAV